MFSKKDARLVLVVVVVTALVSGQSTAPKKSVSVAKCCALNATLTSDNKCLRAVNASWDLRIYANGSLRVFAGALPPRWALREAAPPPCAAPVLEAVTLRTAIPFINGYLMSMRFQKQLPPSQFCLDYDYVKYCPEAAAAPQNISAVLVNKCCGTGAIFSDTNASCVLFKGDDYRLDVGPNKTLGAGFPECPDDRAVAAQLKDAALLGDGRLRLHATGLVLAPANYCLEHILEHAGGSASVITCRQFVPPQGRREPPLKLTIYPVGLAISAIFLAATLAAGSLLPASHHVLHWRCQTNHVACLLVGDVLLCVTQIAGGHFPFWPCFLIAVAMHFVFLAAFFWLNTMCFNIWWTFRDLRPQSTEKSQERIRLYLYEAYAWGVPLIIVFVGAVADLVAPDRDSGFLRPRFALDRCWFPGDSEILTYFFGPMGTLMVINLVLFGLTARELTCGLWKRELVKSTTERAALGRVCAKLVVVMGVSWIMDVISWFAGGPDYVWYFTDIINCLQGVFIFIVVGCQPQVLTAVKRSWCAMRHREGRGMGAASRDRHSSSSQGLPSVGGDTLTQNSTVTNAPKSPPLETNC